jgi:hypothetical protein
MASYSSTDFLEIRPVIEVEPDPISDALKNLLYYQFTIDHNVVGWFYWIDHLIFHQLLTRTQKHIVGDVAELGIANGKSAIAISNYKRKSDNFYLFDISQEFADSAAANIAVYGTDINLQWRVQDSFTLSSESFSFKNKLRFVHIDGAHEHVPVLKDIMNFSEHVADDGVIVLDDYNDPEYPGVHSAAIQFLLENTHWVIFVIGQNKAYLCKREFYNFYALSILDNLEMIGIGCDLGFSFNLREVLDFNVIIVNSRGSQTAQFVRENLNKQISYTST